MQYPPLCFLFLLLVYFFALPSLLLSQNLVVNASFEDANDKEQVLEPENEFAVISGWTSPNLSQPQIYTTKTDGYVYDSNGSSWNFKAHSGNNVAAIYVYGDREDAERREYIQGSLNKKLEVGKRYDFSFWVHYHCEGASNIGIAFLPNNIQLDKKGLIQLEPATYQKKVTPYNDEETWTKVSGSFTAYQPLQYFVIGNFFSNEQTELESNKYDHHLAYIDDISVTESIDPKAPPAPLDEKEKKKWEKNEALAKQAKQPAAVSTLPEEEKEKEQSEKNMDLAKQTNQPAKVSRKFLALPTLLFDRGSSALTTNSLKALDALAAELQTNPDLSISIIGHASSEGGPALNLTISEQRSWQVAKTLLDKGVSAKQLEIRAVGAALPIESNETEEGRRKNRRVNLARYFVAQDSSLTGK